MAKTTAPVGPCLSFIPKPGTLDQEPPKSPRKTSRRKVLKGLAERLPKDVKKRLGLKGGKKDSR